MSYFVIIILILFNLYTLSITYYYTKQQTVEKQNKNQTNKQQYKELNKDINNLIDLYIQLREIDKLIDMCAEVSPMNLSIEDDYNSFDFLIIQKDKLLCKILVLFRQTIDTHIKYINSLNKTTKDIISNIITTIGNYLDLQLSSEKEEKENENNKS